MNYLDFLNFITNDFYSLTEDMGLCASKCGLTVEQAIILITLASNEESQNLLNENILKSLLVKSLVDKKENYTLTGKGKIVAKSLISTLSKN